jgi:hypothetical protein
MGYDLMPCSLSVSLVTFSPNIPQLAATLASFGRAVSLQGEKGGLTGIDFVVVNNGPDQDCAVIGDLLKRELGKISSVRTHLVSGHGNVGFGSGHNIALSGELGDFHLILNPDVELAGEALQVAIDFMQSHPECGLLTPAAFWEDGSRQYLCKRYPTIFDLILRGFAPMAIRQRFEARLKHYEMREFMGEKVFWDPPIASGCFMLFRADVLRRLGGFDPRYFLYFEDFDLSLRSAQISRTAYVPGVRIVHHGGHAAKKGWRHLVMFGRSAARFFGMHGWRWV